MGLEGIGGERRGQAESCRRSQGLSLDARVNGPSWFWLAGAQGSRSHKWPQGGPVLKVWSQDGPPWWSSVKTPPASAGVTGSIPGAERSHLLQSHQARGQDY